MPAAATKSKGTPMKKQKRLTAAQKEAAEIAAIRARIEDMARGAHGHCSPEDSAEDGICVWQTIGPEAFERWMEAMYHTFLPDEGDRGEWRMHFGHNRLTRFESLDKAAKYLHGLGVRA